jgi:hypothetical protein
VYSIVLGGVIIKAIGEIRDTYGHEVQVSSYIYAYMALTMLSGILQFFTFGLTCFGYCCLSNTVDNPFNMNNGLGELPVYNAQMPRYVPFNSNRTDPHPGVVINVYNNTGRGNYPQNFTQTLNIQPVQFVNPSAGGVPINTDGQPVYTGAYNMNSYADRVVNSPRFF